MTKTLLLALAFTLALGAVSARADEPTANVPDLPLLLETIRSNKKALVAENLGLTPEQATKFWPVYDEYQKALNPLQERLANLIADYRKSYATITDEKAMQLMQEYLTVEADRNAVRREWLPKFAAVVPGREVARFYQIENKMEAVVRFDLASTIPVVKP